MRMNTHLHVVPRLRMSGAMPTLSVMPSWRVEGQLYFLGAFAKLRIATISFVISVCLSVCTSACNNSPPTGRTFMKFDIRIFFESLSRKLTFDYNLTRTVAILHADVCTFIFR